MGLVSLADKIVVITGASTGIGKTTAILASQLGARVVMLARNEEKLQQVCSKLTGTGHMYISIDLRQFDQYDAVFERIGQECGPISGLVHSAGVSGIIPLRNTTNSDIENIMSLNLTSFLLLAKQVTRSKLVDKRGCSVVGISSIAAQVSNKGLAIYSATKAGLEGAVRALAIEFGSKNIRFNAVAPGWLKTELTDKSSAVYSPETKAKMMESYPLGDGTTVDIAATVAFLLSNASRWTTGTTITVDGGYTCR